MSRARHRAGPARTGPALVVIVVVLSLLAPGAAPALGELPRGDDPGAFTEHDLRRAQLAFNQRTLAGAYREVGKRDPRWDAAAETFLDALAVYFAYGSANARYRAQAAPSHDEALRLARAARDAGCDDPLVVYGELALTLDRKADVSVEARTALAAGLRGAVEGLSERGYPPHRVASAAKRLRRIYDQKTPAPIAVADADRERCRKILDEYWLAAAADKTLGGDNRRFLWTSIGKDMLAEPLDRQAELLDALRNREGADPWFVNTFAGHHHVKRAWEKRGGAWAQQVGEEAWAGFYEHLEKARESLVKAYEIDPRTRSRRAR